MSNGELLIEQSSPNVYRFVIVCIFCDIPTEDCPLTITKCVQCPLWLLGEQIHSHPCK